MQKYLNILDIILSSLFVFMIVIWYKSSFQLLSLIDPGANSIRCQHATRSGLQWLVLDSIVP